MALQQRFKKSLTPAVPFVGPRLLSPKAAAVYLDMSVDLIYELIRETRGVRMVSTQLLLGSEEATSYFAGQSQGAT